MLELQLIERREEDYEERPTAVEESTSASAPQAPRLHVGGGSIQAADIISFRNLTLLGFSFEEATLVSHVAKIESEGLCEAGLTANHVLQSISIEVMRRRGLDNHLADKMQIALGMPRRGALSVAAELMNGYWPWRLTLTVMIGTSGTELSTSLIYVRGFGRQMIWRLVSNRSVPLPNPMAEFYSRFVANNILGNCGEISDKIIRYSKSAGHFVAAQINGWIETFKDIPTYVLPFNRPLTKNSIDLISTFLITARFTTSPITVNYEDFSGTTREKTGYGILTFIEPEDLARETGIPVHARHRQTDQAEGGSGAPLSGIQDDIWECAMLLDAFPDANAVLHINGGGQANGHIKNRNGVSVGDDFGPCAGLINQAAEVTTGDFLDRDGKYAAEGRILVSLFVRILARYLELNQRKAGNEGIKAFVKFCAEECMEEAGTNSDERARMASDILATVSEVVAVILIAKIKELAAKTGTPEVVEFSGGAWWNKHLTRRFQAHWKLWFKQEPAWTTFEAMHPGTGARNDTKEDLLLAQLSHMGSAGQGFASVATGVSYVVPGTTF